jgi:uncharacterized protein (TIGR02588 family)
VVNRGDNTAENVQVAVEIHMPGGETERSEVELQYLPRQAMRHAWVTFRRDPREGKVEARVLGYQRP